MLTLFRQPFSLEGGAWLGVWKAWWWGFIENPSELVGVTLADKPPIEMTLEEKLPNMLNADGRFGRPRLSEFGPDTYKFTPSKYHLIYGVLLFDLGDLWNG